MSDGWARARNVLCIRLDTIGDVLMTTPAIRACRGACERRITLLTSPAGAPVAPLVPEIDDVIVADVPWMKHAARPPRDPDMLELVERLRARRFDAAVVFTVYTQSPLPVAMLAWLAGIPLRLAHCRENPYDLLSDWVREPEPEIIVRHEVRRQLDLIAAAGWRTDDERLSLRVPEATRRDALAALRAAGIDPARPWIAVHPGASAPSRRYPPEMYAEAIRFLIAEGLQVAITGAGSEAALAGEITAGAPDAVSLAGALDLPTLAGLIEAAPLLVANNTGPVHIAAAAGTPVVDVYALTNPQHTPWLVPSRVLTHDVPCRNCLSSICKEGHHDCLRKIPPAAVAAAALDLLRETGAGVAPRQHARATEMTPFQRDG